MAAQIELGPKRTSSGGAASRARIVAITLAVAILVLVCGYVAGHARVIRANVGNRDSIQYWASGRLLVEHQNPYDVSAVLSLERNEAHAGETGSAKVRAVQRVFRVPPWGLTFIAPLGLLDPFWAWFAWFVCSVVAIVVSVRLCRDVFEPAGRVADNCALAAYLFAPVLACLEAGQIDVFLLLGIVLFLRWESKRPFAAGAALLLPFFKPHLFLLFGIACALWIVARRRWSVLAGFATGLTLFTVAALWLDPGSFAHYRGLVAQEAIGDEFIPGLAGVFRLVVARHYFWVQFIPALAGAVWTIWFWAKHRAEWSWRGHGVLVLLISVLVSPYSWLADEIVLVPVIYLSATWIFGGRISKKASVVVVSLIALNGVLLLMAVVQVPLPSGAYVWSGVVWLGWHFAGRKVSRLRAAELVREGRQALVSAS